MDLHVIELSQALEEKLQQFEKDQEKILREQLTFFRTAVQRIVELHENNVIRPLQQENHRLHLKVAHLEGPSDSNLRLCGMQRNGSARTGESSALNSKACASFDMPSLVNSRLSSDVASMVPLRICRNSTEPNDRNIGFQSESTKVMNLSSIDLVRSPACREDADSEWMSIATEWDTGGAPHITMCHPLRLEPPSGRKILGSMPEMCTVEFQQPPQCPATEKPPEVSLKATASSHSYTRETTFSMLTGASVDAVAAHGSQDFNLKPTTLSVSGSGCLSHGTKLERLTVAFTQVKRLTRAESEDMSHPMTVANETLSGQGRSMPSADDFYLLQMWREHLSCILTRVNDGSQSLDAGLAGTRSSFGYLFRRDRAGSAIASEFVSKTVITYLAAGAQRLVLSPCCGKRLWWDVNSMVLTLYDLIMIPLVVFELPETNFSTFMFWFTIAFWTFDIVLSFFTGVQTNQGMEMRLHRIAAIYIKSWLAIDVVIIAPEWTMLLADHAAEGEDTRMTRLGKLLKVMRFARSIRLLRIFRFTRALSGVQDRLKSEFILNLMDFGKLVGGLAFLNHYLSCFWFVIGRIQESGWVDKYSMRTMDKEYQYLTSMHWSISQFHGSMEVTAQTSWERLVSIITAFLGLILSSLFISSITNLIMRMQKLHQETFLKTRKLLRYLNENGISQNLTWRIKRFTRLTANATVTRIQDVELLNTLPAHLLEEIMVETKAPSLHMNAVLKHCVHQVPQAKKQLCQEVLSEAFVKSGGLVFGHAEKSGQMFLILKGEVMYHPNSWSQKRNDQQNPDTGSTRFSSSQATETTNRSESSPSKFMGAPAFFPRSRSITAAKLFFNRLSGEAPEGTIESEMKVVAGHFISEMNLWTFWAHRGDCIVSGCATIFSVDAAAFGKVMMVDKNHSVELALDISQYATQYINWLNSFGVSNQHHLHDCAFPSDLGIDPTNDRFMVSKTTSLPSRVADRLKGFIRRSIVRVSGSGRGASGCSSRSTVSAKSCRSSS